MSKAGAIRAGRAYVEMFGDDTKLQQSLRASENKLNAYAAKIGNIGRRITMVSAAAAMPGVISTRIFAEFDDQMRSVQAVTQSTGKEFYNLTEQAKFLGRTTSYTARQVAAAMLELGRGGFDSSQIKNTISQVLNLGRATGTELALAAQIAMASMNQFNISAEDSGRVIDALVAGTNNSAQTLDDLGQAMGYAGAIANDFEASFQETVKTIGALANVGIKGTMAGTSIRMMMTQLASPAVQKTLQNLGVSVGDAGYNFRNFTSIMQELGTVLKQMPNMQRMALLKEIFGQRAMTGGAKLITADFHKLNNAVDNASGIAEKTAGKMDAGLGGFLRIMASAIEGVALELGGTLSKALSDAASRITKVAGRVVDWIKAHRALVNILAATLVMTLAFGGSLLVIAGVIKATAIAVGVLRMAMTAAAGTFALLNTAIIALTSPIGALTLGVVALGLEIANMTGASGTALAWLGNKFSDLARFAKEVFNGIGAALAQGDIALAATILWSLLKRAWYSGVYALQAIWSRFKSDMSTSWYVILAGARTAWHGLKMGWIATVEVMKKVWAGFQSYHAKAVEATAHGMLRTYYAAKNKTGLMSDDEYKNALDYLEAEKEAATGQIDAEFAADVNAARSKADAERKAASQQHLAETESLASDEVARQQALDAQRQMALAKTDAQIAAAKKAYADAIARAHQEQKKAEDESDKPGGGKVSARLNGVLGALSGNIAASSVTGTFNAFAASGLGASNPLADVATYTKQTAENTSEMAYELSNSSGAVFS
ncbi:MAG: phage tail tape measure protein [Phycisphaerae bacterium]|nr:phage tail tape measure protein [Phycisphaerae bacterium]